MMKPGLSSSHRPERQQNQTEDRINKKKVTANETPAAKVAGFFVARGAPNMVFLKQKSG